MQTIGLTGGFGCGKSTVVAALGAFPDLATFDCDASAKRIIASERFRPTLAALFPDAALVKPDGSVDTKAIAKLVFGDPVQLKRLEAAVHPLVRQEIDDRRNEAAASGQQLFVIESAILFESGLCDRCDRTVCVSCDPDIRRQRLKDNRGFSDQEIDARLARQMPLEEKEGRADYVFLNDDERESAGFNYDIRRLYLWMKGIEG